MATPKLESYVDHRIMLCIAGRKNPITAILRSIDEHGVWIECAELSGELLGSKRPPSRLKPVVFVPFAQLQYVLGVLDEAAPTIIDNAA